jgi:hypothetical protein
MHTRTVVIALLLGILLCTLPLAGSLADQPLKKFSLGALGAYHLRTTYTDPLGNSYTEPGEIDQQKYFGLSLRWFFGKSIGIGCNALLLDATDTMYEFGTLVLGALDLLYRLRLSRRLVFNAGAGISRLYLYIKDKATQATSLQQGDIAWNVKLGAELFLGRSFSLGAWLKVQEYTDQHNFKTRMCSLVASASFWL